MLPYYERFVSRFPSVFSLAEADLDEVFKYWEGLGYYRRAEHLHRTARIIAGERQGRFPSTAKDLIKLPGIGPYTAAAVASFAFGEAIPVLDGNVMRVLARLYGEETPVNTEAGKKILTEAAEKLLDRSQPGLFNQAVMEFGALQCTPHHPSCNSCPLAGRCAAYATGKTAMLPVKLKKKPLRTRYLHYVIHIRNGGIAVRRRIGKDIWNGLYEFPLMELPGEEAVTKVRQILSKRFDNPAEAFVLIGRRVHLLTHQRLKLYFWRGKVSSKEAEIIDLQKVSTLAFPVPLKRFLDNYLNIPNFDNER